MKEINIRKKTKSHFNGIKYAKINDLKFFMWV